MSATVVIEQPEKKREELQNELALLEQKMQAAKEEIRKLEEKLTAKLEEKVNAKRAAMEKLESQKNDLEKQLEKLENNQQPGGMPVLCQHCGSENITNALFCEKCGKKIAAESSPPTPP